jgi:hypothetical protein
MANINCVPISANDFSENLLNKKASFDYGVDYTVNSGSGLVELQTVGANNSDPLVFKGRNSLKITNTAYKTTDLVFSSPTGLDKITFDEETNGFISLYVLKPSATAINSNIKLEVFMDGSASDVYFFPLTTNTLPDANQWVRIGQNITFQRGYVYTFRWTFERETASVPTSRTIYIDGFCIQQLNQNSLAFQPYLYPKDILLTTTQTIDVPSISSNSNHILEVTLTGANVGDYVQTTYPAELITLGIIVGVPIVTATDTVKMILHNHSGASVNPASGSYTFKIVK